MRLRPGGDLFKFGESDLEKTDLPVHGTRSTGFGQLSARLEVCLVSRILKKKKYKLRKAKNGS